MEGDWTCPLRFRIAFRFVGARRLGAAVLAVGGTGIAGTAFAGIAPPAYTLTDLGTLPGDVFSNAAALNDKGQVAGSSSGGMFVTTGNGAGHVLQSIGTLGTYGNIPHGININGDVVGESNGHAFRYSGGVIRDLGALGGSTSSAWAINASGQIVGWAETNAHQQDAFLYAAGVMHDLGPGLANGINDAGQVVGLATRGGTSHTHAFLYANGQAQDLGTLGGTDSVATGISNTGFIVGTASVADGATHPFLYSAGVMHDLGTLPGHPDGEANAVNDAGEVVGVFYGGYPFVYADGTMYDLTGLIVGAPGYHLDDAFGINSSGQIVGFAVSPNSSYRAVLLTPTSAPVLTTPAAVPLPSATWTGLGTIGLLAGALAIRKRRAAIPPLAASPT